MENRNKNLVLIYDYLRAIAIILVVIGHSTYLVISTELGGVQYELPSNLNSHYYNVLPQILMYLSGWVYKFHMPLFFIISGAVYGHIKQKILIILLERR